VKIDRQRWDQRRQLMPKPRLPVHKDASCSDPFKINPIRIH
jgi:hypothetical protein